MYFIVYALQDTCINLQVAEFGLFENNDMLCSRLVCSMADLQIHHQLQESKTLTLEKASNIYIVQMMKVVVVHVI